MLTSSFFENAMDELILSSLGIILLSILVYGGLLDTKIEKGW